MRARAWYSQGSLFSRWLFLVLSSTTAQNRVELSGGYSFGHTRRTNRFNGFVQRAP
jgi:hypothetical protein